MKRKQPKERPSWPESKDRLIQLPMTGDEAWQVGTRRFPGWVEEGGPPRRPWMVLVVRERGMPILASKVVADPPSADQVWAVLEEALFEPLGGRPHRPAEVQVGSMELRDGIAFRLGAIGVRCAFRETLAGFDDACRAVELRFRSDADRFALVLVPGLARDRVAAFFSAAADYHVRRPWTLVESDSILRVDSGLFKGSPWFAVPIGQSGTCGLAIHDDLESLQSMIEEEHSGKEAAKRLSGASVVFGPPQEIPIPDLEAAESGGWPIAGPQAYPYAYRIHHGGKLRPAAADEIEALITCLRAVPAFLEGPGDADPEVKVTRLK